MQVRCTLLALVFGLLAAAAALAQTKATETRDSKQIEELVKHLGSSRYVDRDRAQKELETIGAPALDALRKAAKEGDLETSRRAAEMVRKMEEKISNVNLLTPKLVNLKLKDVPVLDAVADLAKQSGYVLQVDGDRTALANRKITLETGDVSFWEALDRLCAKAELVEKVNVAVNPYGVPSVRPLPAIKARPLPAPAPKAPPAGVLPVVPDGNANPPKAGAQAVPANPAPAPAPAVPAKALEQAVQQLQIQVQVQGVQIAPGGGLVQVGRTPVQGNTRQITLADGKPAQLPTSYSGAVRVRLLPPESLKLQKKAGEANLVLEATPEPRLLAFQVMGNPNFTKLIDDQGQTLTVSLEPPQAVNPNVVPGQNIMVINGAVWNPYLNQQQSRPVAVRLRLGEKKASTIKELSGILTAQVQLPPEPLIVIDNVLKAGGQTAKGKNEGSLTLQSIEKTGNNDYKVQMTIENAGANPFGGGFQVIGNAQVMIGTAAGSAGAGMPELVDAKGKAYQVAQVLSRGIQVNNGSIRQNLTLVYRASAGQGEPARLVQSGSRTTTMEVPFTFKDVPLP